ncbi:MAG: drug/metabolite transporter, family [Chloroflexota bacterium]|nr:drug/metabolite transporter, family [Chloroflexota bacterium]
MGKELALLTAICFGLNPVTLKMGFARNGRTDVAVAIGLAVAVPMYLVLLPFWGGLHLELLTVPALLGFIAGGLFGGGIGRRWMYIAIDKLGASPATAIKNAAPVITTILAVLFFGEQVDLFHWLAIIGIVAGITLVTWKKGGGIKQLAGIGVLAAVGSALSYGIRPLFLKFGLDSADLPLTGTLIGALAALGYTLALTKMSDIRAGLTERATLLFVVSGVLQAIGFLALTVGLASNDVSVVYPVTSSAPLFTVAFTALMLRGLEVITWRIVVGVLLVVGGVIAL